MANAPRREDITTVINDLESRVKRIERMPRSPLFLPESAIPNGRVDGGQLVVSGDALHFIDETGSDTVVVGAGGAGDKNFTATYSSSTLYTVVHNLGKYPEVTTITSAGDEIYGYVNHINVNQLTVAFTVAPGVLTITCN